MQNFPKKKGSELEKAFVGLVDSDLNVNIEPSGVLVIYSIPGKQGYQKPVIFKVRNPVTKIRMMR